MRPAAADFLQLFNHGGNRLFRAQAVQKSGINRDAVVDVVERCLRDFGNAFIFMRHDDTNGQAVLAGEIKVALVMRRARENRARRFPVYFSSLTVWFVTGIWHGASWNFVVWGLLNSIIMLVSQELKPLYEKADNRLGYRKLKYYKVFEIIRTTAIVCCLQMLDYYRNIAEAFRMFFSMFTGGNYAAVFTKGMWSIGLSAADYIVLFAGVVIMFVVSLLERRCPVREQLAQKNYIIRYTVFLVIFLLIAVLGIYGTGYESSQFIYNQF